MPVNAGAEYLAAERKYQKAKTVDEKIAALEEMLATVPKHKGTENLRRELKRKLAALRREKEEKAKQAKKSGKKGLRKILPIMISIASFPNAGKSLLLTKLTNARPKVSEVPFTTTEPEVGVLDYKGAKIQLVELPSLLEDAYERQREYLGIIKNSDFVMLLVNNKEQLDKLIALLEKANIKLDKERPKVKIIRRSFGGLEIFGKDFVKDFDMQYLKDIAESYGIHNAEIVVQEPITMEQLKDAFNEGLRFIKSIKILNVFTSPLEYKELKPYFDAIINLKAMNEKEVEELKKFIFKKSGLIRIYTKEPNEKEAKKEPMVLKKGSTIKDLAENLHKDFVENFAYARVWGKSTKFPGQKVGLEHVLEDQDIVEIHTK